MFVLSAFFQNTEFPFSFHVRCDLFMTQCTMKQLMKFAFFHPYYSTVRGWDRLSLAHSESPQIAGLSLIAWLMSPQVLVSLMFAGKRQNSCSLAGLAAKCSEPCADSPPPTDSRGGERKKG